MKIAITSEGNSEKSQFDRKFGRAAWICVFDKANNEIVFVENKNKNLNGGAGTKTAEKIAELGVEKVISGDFGPKAKEMLSKLKIDMIILQRNKSSIEEIINDLT